jgi:hypothetical protein
LRYDCTTCAIHFLRAETSTTALGATSHAALPPRRRFTQPGFNKFSESCCFSHPVSYEMPFRGKENDTMKRLLIASLTGLAVGSLIVCAAGVQPAFAQETAKAGGPPPASAAKVMREFRGIKLGLKSEQVHAALGKPESPGDEREEYKLSDDDMLTVHYDKGVVRAIQLYFTNPKNAPAWAEVVGSAEVAENASGGKHARVVMREENFWVSMFQNKDQTVTTITISR